MGLTLDTTVHFMTAYYLLIFFLYFVKIFHTKLLQVARYKTFYSLYDDRLFDFKTELTIVGTSGQDFTITTLASLVDDSGFNVGFTQSAPI